MQPLFLDVLTTSDITDSNGLKSPHVFKGFILHRIIYMEGGISRTQVAFPHLNGKTESHLLNFQKQLLIPELCENIIVSAALAEKMTGIGTSPMTQSTPLVWKCSGGGMNPPRPPKQASLPRVRGQEGEIPQV